ncbi:MAG: rhamnulose-1-phosphate aldolase, partial [Chitinivibrionales bacterium]|nr:rhamnulose-1-phosphate aldolase [Chitinivibrionales bacterium]
MNKPGTRTEKSVSLTSAKIAVARIASYLWEKGWAERNAGNISVNMTGFFAATKKPASNARFIPLSRAYPALANMSLLISGTGTRMRNIAERPGDNLCLIHIAPDADRAFIAGTTMPTVKPTSELPAHLAVHEALALRKGPQKVVIHTHPDALVALSHIAQYKNESSLNAMLWSMHPETIVVLPEGAGFVPYQTPGSAELGAATGEALMHHRV